MSYNDIRTTEPPYPTPVSQDDYDALAAQLAEAERERNTWQSHYSTLLDEFKDLRDGKVPELQARLAEQERALDQCRGLLRQQVEAVGTLKKRLASADIEATSLLMAMIRQWPDVHPDWKPLPDVAGKITQINNMVAGLRARLAEAEAALQDIATTFHGNPTKYMEAANHAAEVADAYFMAYEPTVSASVVQYKPCEICTTQSWCETHGCQCYPVSAVQPERCCLDYPRCDCNSPPEPAQEPKGCNHFPGQVNCEWCTEVPHE